ncbi:hypothetical protein [Mannheimia indoligenes]|uniref:hypothetical protein n=1 Tax=Mannheimia indoligenes TaxID=3103145 RepID=UPI002FE524AD
MDNPREICGKFDDECLFNRRQSEHKSQLIGFQAKYQADELIAINYIFDEEKQLKSYSLLKEVVEGL